MKLLERMHERLRTLHYSYRTEEAYVQWAERFLRYHRKQPPDPGRWKTPEELGAKGVERFLTHLAVDRHVAASTQNQALNALVFLYKRVLEVDLGKLDAQRAKRPERLPEVLSRREVAAVLDAVLSQGQNPWAARVYGLMAGLMYGGGLRLMEACRMRVKDVDLDRGRLTVRDGKGGKDRAAILPEGCVEAMRTQLKWRAHVHETDRSRGHGWAWVPMPYAQVMKQPGAGRSFGVAVRVRLDTGDAVAGGAAVYGWGGGGVGTA